jgi:tetratricopeptide (TPR) repeat protein
LDRWDYLDGGKSRRSSRLLTLLALIVCALQNGCHWQSKGINTSGVQLYQQGRYGEALQQFETARQTNPTDPDALYNLASTYHQMGIANKDSKLLEQAESTYNQCLDVSPNHLECHRGLAVLLVQTNRSDRAFG